jgi:acetylornithine deacetylase/succinyl-diaminopimelate desuccinylase-like protein
VIPGEVSHSLDLRHGDDQVRERAVEGLRETARSIAAGRGGGNRWQPRQESGAVPTDPGLTALLARAVEDLGYRVERLPSGAGHDAAELAEIAPIAMLFVRCLGGISHNPAESVSSGDVAVAIEATSRFLALVAEARS